MKGKLKSTLDEPSLILLSSNRAATQLVEDVLSKIYDHCGVTYIALNRFLFFFERGGKSSYLNPSVMVKRMKSHWFFFGQQRPLTDHEVFKDLGCK